MFIYFYVNVQSEPIGAYIVYILSAIVIFIFPRRIVTSVAFQLHKYCMKCEMDVQTEVALQNIEYVYNLGPHI